MFKTLWNSKPVRYIRACAEVYGIYQLLVGGGSALVGWGATWALVETFLNSSLVPKITLSAGMSLLTLALGLAALRYTSKRWFPSVLADGSSTSQPEQELAKEDRVSNQLQEGDELATGLDNVPRSIGILDEGINTIKEGNITVGFDVGEHSKGKGGRSTGNTHLGKGDRHEPTARDAESAVREAIERFKARRAERTEEGSEAN